MTNVTGNKNPENRALVFMPTGRDAALVCRMLENAGIATQPCFNLQELEENIALGVGVILLAEEALIKETFEYLIESFDRQPVWSDLPIIIFAGSAVNSEKLLVTVGTHLNATIVERPIRIAILVSAVRGALRARERQYQSRDLLNQLKESDQQKDLFLATLSHELRTPLNSILGWIQILRGESNIPANIERALTILERNARAQSQIISDILFISRVITGKLTLSLKNLDLISAVEAAIDVVRPSLEAKDIRLNTFFEQETIHLTGDFDRLQQIFWNLLSNAVKFTPPGGKIDIRTRIKDAVAEIEISDSGQGIDAEFLPYVFERFRQEDNSYTRQFGGLGLGLAIVRHLLELHGGSVGVKSEGENHGAVFTVTLPILFDQQRVADADTDSGKSITSGDDNEKLKGVRLLLVEDNDDSREMLKVLFEQYDMDVVAVDTAAKALEEFKRAQPKILISDVGLPDEDGYALIGKIRKLPSEQGGLVPAIALTGYASLQDHEQALAVGYQKHLAKPIDIDELIELVEDMLNHKS